MEFNRKFINSWKGFSSLILFLVKIAFFLHNFHATSNSEIKIIFSFIFILSSLSLALILNAFIISLARFYLCLFCNRVQKMRKGSKISLKMGKLYDGDVMQGNYGEGNIFPLSRARFLPPPLPPATDFFLWSASYFFRYMVKLFLTLMWKTSLERFEIALNFLLLHLIFPPPKTLQCLPLKLRVFYRFWFHIYRQGFLFKNTHIRRYRFNFILTSKKCCKDSNKKSLQFFSAHTYESMKITVAILPKKTFLCIQKLANSYYQYSVSSMMLTIKTL